MDMHSIVNVASDMNNDLRNINTRLREAVTAIFGVTPELPQEPPLGPKSQDVVAKAFNFIEAMQLQTVRQAYYLKYAMEMLERLEDFTTDKAPNEPSFNKRYVGGIDPNKTSPFNENALGNQMSDSLAQTLENFDVASQK